MDTLVVNSDPAKGLKHFSGWWNIVEMFSSKIKIEVGTAVDGSEIRLTTYKLYKFL